MFLLGFLYVFICLYMFLLVGVGFGKKTHCKWNLMDVSDFV